MIEWIITYRVFIAATAAAAILAAGEGRLRGWLFDNPGHRYSHWARHAAGSLKTLFWGVIAAVFLLHLYGALTQPANPDRDGCHVEYDNRGAHQVCE